MIKLMVVYATKYKAKDGTEGTQLLVPVGTDVYPVFCRGDKTNLQGLECNFNLTSYKKELRLRLNEDDII